MASIHTKSISDIQYISMRDIRRPAIVSLETDKLERMQEAYSGVIGTLKQNTGDDLEKSEEEIQMLQAENSPLPPVDVLCLREGNKTIYFAFGACHRLKVYDLANQEIIPCKVVECTRSSLFPYLGSRILKCPIDEI